MSVDDIKDWAWSINVVGAVLLAIAVQYLRGIFVAKDRVEGIERELSSQETRLRLIEAKLNEVAALKDRFHALHGDMKALTAELRGFKEVFAGAQHILNLVHRHLLENDK